QVPPAVPHPSEQLLSLFRLRCGLSTPLSWQLTALFYTELINANVVVLLAWLQLRRRERWLIGAIGKMLGFQCERFAIAVRLARFSDFLAGEKISTIELNARL